MEERQPSGAADRRLVVEVSLQRGRERATEAVAQIVTIGRVIPAQEKQQRQRVARHVARDRIEHRRRDGFELFVQPSNYNERMAVVRFAALVALVVWLGGLQGAVFGNRSGGLPTWLAYTTGGLIVVSLFAMKFLGPPPHSFVARVALVTLMLVLTLVDQFYRLPAVTVITLALGFVLLAWYVRE